VPRFPRTRAETKLDVSPYVGQLSSSWRFDLVDVVTGYRRAINPVIDGNAGIRHDTRSTIKRMISGLTLSPADTAVFNSISSRLEPFMLVGDQEFQVGRYVPSDWARFRLSAGGDVASSASFYDETFIVDQQISTGFGALSTVGETVTSMIRRFLVSYPVNYHIDDGSSSFLSLGAWAAGTRGGFILEQLALDGDFLSPWFDNASILQFKRTFDPALEFETFDFDVQSGVILKTIIESDNLINAPNRFVVIGNGASSLGASLVGSADVPSSAPHSIEKRGFVIADVQNRQVTTAAQAGAIAQNLMITQSLVEQVELQTPTDPRHDSYDIIKWQDNKWTEIAWTMPFASDGLMSHTLRRAYS
jgi:hypothetical protein